MGTRERDHLPANPDQRHEPDRGKAVRVPRVRPERCRPRPRVEGLDLGEDSRPAGGQAARGDPTVAQGELRAEPQRPLPVQDRRRPEADHHLVQGRP